jgi:hypothetical protein
MSPENSANALMIYLSLVVRDAWEDWAELISQCRITYFILFLSKNLKILIKKIINIFGFFKKNV